MAYLVQFRIALMSLVATFFIATAGSGGEIHDLLRKGEIEKAKALLKKDPKQKDARDDSQMTPLHTAVQLGHLEMAKLLLEQGADVNARAYNDFTPLYFAKDPEMVKLLIANKADLEAMYHTTLQNAAECYCRWCDCKSESTEVEKKECKKIAEKWRTITKILLDAGAYYDIFSAVSLDDLNRVKALLQEDPRKALDKSLMRHAVQAGRATSVKLLLDYKADPNDCGYPVLYFALEHPDVVRVLIQAGADPKARVKYHGTSPVGTAERPPTWEELFHYVATIGQVETAKLLVEAGVEVNYRSKNGNTTPLEEASFWGHVDMVKFLLKNKASIQGEDGSGAMSMAACMIRHPGQKTEEIARYKAVIAILREAGVPVDVITAVRFGETELVRKLLKEQPTLVSTKYQDTKPLLEIAVGLDLKEIVVALLDAGASIEWSDENGKTALHWASFWGREEIAKLLIDRHANVNARTKNGFTPLHEAARCGKPAVAKLLLTAGADVNAKDNQGQTPLAWAKESDKEIIELLKKHGGK